MSTNNSVRVQQSLQQIVGLRLAASWRAADMRIFHFGTLRPVEGGRRADYALHIQCPWRIDGPHGVITGRADLWEAADEDRETEPLEDYESGNLQDRRMQALLGSEDGVNFTDLLTVEVVQTDSCGGFTLNLSGGFKLAVFPAGSQGEHWRLLPPDESEHHFVCSGPGD